MKKGESTKVSSAPPPATACLMPSRFSAPPRLWLLARQPSATLLSLGAACFALGASVKLLAPNLSAAAASFGLDAASRDVVLGGWSSASFFLLGAPASVATGALVDGGAVSRVLLLRFALVAGGAAVALSGLASAVWQLLALRAVLGAVLGSLQPIVYSLVGDVYPPARRAAAASLFGLALGGGTAVGQVAAGLLAPVGWRAPYLLVAAVAAAAYALVTAVAEEPQRGAAE